MRIHDQLYTQIKTSAGKVYDEQRSRKLYNFAGNNINLNSEYIIHRKRFLLYHILTKTVYIFFKFRVITNRDTQETLLCIAFVFEVSNSEHGAQHHIYKLVKD